MEDNCSVCLAIFKSMHSCPTIPLSLANETDIIAVTFEVLMVICSVIPYFFMLFFLIASLRSKTPSGVFLLLALMFQNFVSEGIKMVFQQSRPENSCSSSYGMPSSHSSFGVCYFIWSLLEAGAAKKVGKKSMLLLLKLAFAFMVIYSRVHLRYHTPQQVTMGGLLGLFTGCSVFYFVRHYFDYEAGDLLKNLRHKLQLKKSKSKSEEVDKIIEKLAEIENIKNSLVRQNEAAMKRLINIRKV